MKSINAGKKFENAIKAAIPPWVLYYRLKDSTGTFSGGNNLRFSSKQPCDAFLFDGKKRILYTLELKSTKGNSFSFEDIHCAEEQPTRMIHKHQINGLQEFSKIDYVVAGFLFNFRDEVNGSEKMYFQEIWDFYDMIEDLDKHSFNEKDLLKYSPIPIEGKKKRVN